MSYFKSKIRNLFRGLVFKFFPELRAITQDVTFNEISSSTSENPAKIYAPYQIVNCAVGDFTFIAAGSRISNTNIGKYCSVGPNFCSGLGDHPAVGISTCPMFYSTMNQNGYSLSSEDKFDELGRVVIGHDVWIGMNVSIVNGVSIGDGSIIGAGAVVTRDIPAYSIAVGVPARVIRMRFSDKEIKQIKRLNWYDWPVSKLQDVADCILNKEEFLSKYADK